MTPLVLCIFLAACVYGQSNILTEFGDLDKQICKILEDPSLQGITEAMHFMNLYCVELSNLSLKLDLNQAADMMKDLVKLYKQGRPKFVDMELDEYELKKYLHAKDDTLVKFKVLQSDNRAMWDEFVTNLIKRSDKPI